MKKVVKKYAGAIAGLALMVTSLNANSTCIFYLHQPKMPENAKKLRKF
ncbi:MAG: cyclic lactone autoinducer peptide [Oscillospiraceae bacterium]